MVEHSGETYCLVKVMLEDFTKIGYKYKVVIFRILKPQNY